MDVGGPTATKPELDDPAAAMLGPAMLGPAEHKVVCALLDCIGRWGLSKTTVEDVARTAGVSRATVYRLFPGGKDSMVRASVQVEVARLVAQISDELEAATTLEDCLVAAMSTSTRCIAESHPFRYLRAHEPEAVESHLAFDRLDGVLALAGTLVSGSLERFLPAPDAYETGVWAARLVVSYLVFPSADVDLADADAARAVVRSHLLPSLAAIQISRPGTPDQGSRISRPTNRPDPAVPAPAQP